MIRRRFLSVIAAGIAAIAGCTGPNESSDTASPDPTTTETQQATTETDTPTPTPTATETETPTPTANTDTDTERQRQHQHQHQHQQKQRMIADITDSRWLIRGGSIEEKTNLAYVPSSSEQSSVYSIL
ncbi:MAG: hypothetical protein J07HQW1_02404 [Haloquadratum walsbyi J07HQW1]|uniref:Uncharacterized protein n=1 Tax=Haloquadratum walsbyi J07HQW1 TaxID=1238424 RepID=U1PFJ3_9EURY|nr:MAG: hypothetical protein J07HQW1_02404 [Haloquadratum walsbyi J07HQW1]